MNSNPVIKVLIADDYEANRTGLSLVFETLKTIKVVGMARNGLEAVQLCATTCPDVVIMDLQMPGMDGIAATQIIKKRFPEIKIIITTSFDDRKKIEEALRAGAMTYLTKDTPIDELITTIRQAYTAVNYP
jgi:DNA-binding NarL/FixJ family response regulator